MNHRTREELRIHLSITLALLPKPVRRDLGERLTSKKDLAINAIVEALIAAIDRHFDIEARETSPVRPPIRY